MQTNLTSTKIHERYCVYELCFNRVGLDLKRTISVVGWIVTYAIRVIPCATLNNSWANLS